MDRRAALELVGYLASALVALSLTMRSVLRLRAINLLGAVVFAIYGALIGAYPVAAVNLFIAGINVYYLRQMLGAREYFTLMPVDADSEYLRRFVDFHRDEIVRLVPGADPLPRPDSVALFVLRDLVPAGLLVGDVGADGVLRVRTDYVLAQYRDLEVGRHLFRGSGAARLRELGVRAVESPPGNAEHERYLRRVGFVRRVEGWRLEL